MPAQADRGDIVYVGETESNGNEKMELSWIDGRSSVRREEGFAIRIHCVFLALFLTRKFSMAGYTFPVWLQ